MKKFIHVITILFFLGYAAIILVTFEDYGITWDEGTQNEYGKRVLRYYVSGMTDGSVFKFGNLYLDGGLFNGVADLFNRISPFGEYETRHLLNAATGFFGVVGVFFFANYLTGSPGIGLLAALFLALTPRYYGHAFNNAKDIPFAVFYLWSVYLLAKASERWRSREISKGADWALGLSMGACMGTRSQGLVMILYLGLVFLAMRRMESADGQPAFPLVQSIKHRLLLPVLIAVCSMFIFWPYSHLNPIGNILNALNMTSHFPWNFPLIFDGQEIKATEAPWNYILKWYSIATPFPQLVGFGLFLFFFVNKVLSTRLEESLNFNLILFSMVFPLVWAIVSKSTLYDGLRHFLFLAPLIAVAAACGYFQLYNTLQIGAGCFDRRGLALKITFLVVLAGGLIPVVQWSVRSHPHQYIYFNQSIGGVRGAFGRFETEYHGNSERQAALWLNAYVKRQNIGKKLTVCTYSNPEQTRYFLDAKYFIFNPEKRNTKSCDLFIASLRWGFAPKGTVLHAFSVDGVPLVYIALNDERLKVEAKK